MAYELFIDGFDHYATADIGKKWFSAYACGISPNTGRRNGGCLDVAWNGVLASFNFTPSSKVVTGFALYVPLNPSAGLRIFFRYNDINQCYFLLPHGSWLWQAVGAAGTVVASATNTMVFGAWNYIEAAVHHDDAGTLELRINGSTLLSGIPLTNADTKATAGASINNIYLDRYVNYGFTGFKIDDLYITYGDEIKFLGDSRVDTLTLTADSSPQDWVPDTGNAWERLNQDAGYISANTANATSIFAANNISHNPSIIHGVQINGLAYKSDAGNREAAMVLKSGANTSVGASLALSTDTLLIRNPHIVDPNTGAAFTKAAVNAMEVGVKVVV